MFSAPFFVRARSEDHGSGMNAVRVRLDYGESWGRWGCAVAWASCQGHPNMPVEIIPNQSHTSLDLKTAGQVASLSDKENKPVAQRDQD